MTKHRVELLRQKMQEKNIEALLVGRPENRWYLTGFTGSSGFVLITQHRCYLLTDFRYIEQARKQAPHCEVVNHGRNFAQSVKELLQQEQIFCLGFEEDYITYHQYHKWQKELESISLQPVKGLVEELRQRKDQEEIALIKRAAQIADAGFKHILGFLKPGVKERDIALELEYFMRQNGASGASFETIVASGLRSSLPHGVASDKVLEPGDFLVLDFGAIFQGYHSDMTRTVVIGKASPKQKNLYNLVLEAQISALEAIRPGLGCNELDKIARDFLADNGYEKEFGHGLGHGVGLAIHEDPTINPHSTDKLVEGMVITIEPGVYIPHFGGVRIEDLVVVTSDGYENLTHSPKEFTEI